MTMFSFNSSILLRCIYVTSLVNDPMLPIKLFPRYLGKFTPIIPSNDFHINPKLSFNHDTKFFHQLRCLTLFLHQISPHTSTSIIKNSKKIASTTERLNTISTLYVTMYEIKTLRGFTFTNGKRYTGLFSTQTYIANTIFIFTMSVYQNITKDLR